MRRASVKRSDDGDHVENVIEIRAFCLFSCEPGYVCVRLRPEFQSFAAISYILDALIFYALMRENSFSH